MPNYFFDVRDSRGFYRDEFGDGFDDDRQAELQARLLLSEIAREQSLDENFRSITCDVRDESDRIVYRGEITLRGAFVGVQAPEHPWSPRSCKS